MGLGAICTPPPGLPLKQIPTETRRDGGAADQAHGNPKTGNSRHQQKEITLEKAKRDEITRMTSREFYLSGPWTYCSPILRA